MMNIAYTIAGAAGGLLILFSLYWRRMTKQAAWAGLIFGVVASIVGRVAMAVGALPEWADPVLPTLLGTALLIVIVSLKTQPDAETIAVYERLNGSGPSEESTSADAPELEKDRI
jgi:Na+/proline symporter